MKIKVIPLLLISGILSAGSEYLHLGLFYFIWQAILPGFIFGIFFCLIYPNLLSSKDKIAGFIFGSATAYFLAYACMAMTYFLSLVCWGDKTGICGPPVSVVLVVALYFIAGSVGATLLIMAVNRYIIDISKGQKKILVITGGIAGALFLVFPYYQNLLGLIVWQLAVGLILVSIINKNTQTSVNQSSSPTS